MTGRRMLPSRALVKLRFILVIVWIAGAVVAATHLPSISSAKGGSLGALVPKNAPALRAEEYAAQHFAFPLLSETIVVVRNPHGLAAARQAQLVGLAERLTRGQVPGFGSVAGALPLVNTLGIVPFAHEHGTTVLLYLFFRPSVDAYHQTLLARRLVTQQVGRQPGEFAGVTSQAPGEVARTSLINQWLKWVELATVLLVAVAIAVHFRALGASLLAVLAVGIAYVLADRLVAQFGKATGINVPAEVQPVLVVLVFGVVTDYTVFFLSRFRALLREGVARLDAAVRVVHEISPIVAVAGLTVAAGTAALLVAHLEFLRAFGPGLALAVLIAMVVAVFFVPAVLAVFGRAIYWPRGRPDPPAAMAAEAGTPPVAPVHAQAPVEAPVQAQTPVQAPVRRLWTVRFAVGHPLVAAVVALALVLGAASGLLRIALGNEVVVGLPTNSAVYRGYVQASDGFAPGVLSPGVVVVRGSGVGAQRPALARLQRLLVRQRGIAEVVGPADSPTRSQFGITISRTGNAARYAFFLSTDPLGATAITRTRHLVDRLPSLVRQSGLRNAKALVGGDTALSADSVNDTLSDLTRVTPTTLAAIFLVVAIFLRALVAPLYLVLTSALSALASLGLTVYALQIGLGYGQITYYVVFVSAVLLVSLGSDYNVFLVGRIWQEGRRRGLREAVEVGGTGAARPITVAGLVLAMSFALLAIVPVRPFREIAFTVGIGLIIDAFIVRTILVPALLMLVGTRSAWPGRALRGRRRERTVPQPSET